MLGLTKDEDTETHCEVTRLCDGISDDISHLFRVASLIGKSIARDRYARAETASEEKFDDRYDVAHVKTKFQQSKAPGWLLDRLGQAITKRRQYLKYVREHRSRIDHIPAVSKTVAPPAVALRMDSPDLFDRLGLGTLASDSPSRPSQLPTSASTVSPVAMLNIEQTGGDNHSVTTADTTAFGAEPDQVLSVPPLSIYAQPGQEFACPFCPTANKFGSQRSWK